MNKINETDLIRMIGLQDDLANSIQRKLRERIDRLSTENARLREALETLERLSGLAMYQAKLQMARLEAENARLQGNWEAAEKEVQSLNLENARLRAALQRIAMRCQNCDEGNEYATCICFSEPFADQIARAALHLPTK